MSDAILIPETMDEKIAILLKGKSLGKIEVVSPPAFVKWENLTWKALYSVVFTADRDAKRSVSFGVFDNVPYFTAMYLNDDKVLCGIVLSCSINKEANYVRGAYVVGTVGDTKIVQRIPKMGFADVPAPYKAVSKRLLALRDKHLAQRGIAVAESGVDKAAESVVTLELALEKAKKREAKLLDRLEKAEKAEKEAKEKPSVPKTSEGGESPE